MEEKLFKIALEYINKYSIKAYAMNFYPGSYYGKEIKLQGDAEKNEKILESLEFVFDVENSWYVYSVDNIEITIVKQ